MSIFTFPEMLRYRPIVYDPVKMVPLGGNARLLGIQWLYDRLKKRKAADLPECTDEEQAAPILEALFLSIFGQERQYKGGPETLKAYFDLRAIYFGEFPADSVVRAGFTDEQKREFIAKDNGHFGKPDFEALANEYDFLELKEWGIFVPGMEEGDEEVPGEDPPAVDQDVDQDVDQTPSEKWVPDCLFESNNEFDIPTLRLDLQASQVLNPVAPWGYSARDAKNIGTYHFYVDDYRFTGLWDDPNKLIKAGVPVVIEPNLSLYDNTPRGYGLFLIYKKRWIARYWQSFGVRVFVDLNVSHKFARENLLGVPKGWNSYATRGYSDRLQLLEAEYDLAKEHSGKEDPYFVVYGGGEKVRKWVRERNLTYIEQIMAEKFR
jgi:hypothetical protein